MPASVAAIRSPASLVRYRDGFLFFQPVSFGVHLLKRTPKLHTASLRPSHPLQTSPIQYPGSKENTEGYHHERVTEKRMETHIGCGNGYCSRTAIQQARARHVYTSHGSACSGEVNHQRLARVSPTRGANRVSCAGAYNHPFVDHPARIPGKNTLARRVQTSAAHPYLPAMRVTGQHQIHIARPEPVHIVFRVMAQ